jgi:membrane-bound ClpP family serine protease
MISSIASAVIIQLLGGLVLIAEFLLPSAGILTVLALGLFGYSIYSVFAHVSFRAGMIMLAVDLFFIPFLIYIGFQIIGRTPIALKNRLASSDGVTMQEGAVRSLAGKTGTVIQDCRPSGKIDIEGKKYDAVANGEYLQKGTAVRVHEISGNRIVICKE